MKRIIAITDTQTGFFEWRDGRPRIIDETCPVTGTDHADYLGLERVTIDPEESATARRKGFDLLSAAWGITRLEAAAVAYAMVADGTAAYVFDPEAWETAVTPRPTAPQGRPEATERDDPTAARRSTLVTVIASAPATKEALAGRFGVTTRTIIDDLAAVGAVSVGKDGRKVVYGMPSRERSDHP